MRRWTAYEPANEHIDTLTQTHTHKPRHTAYARTHKRAKTHALTPPHAHSVLHTTVCEPVLPHHAASSGTALTHAMTRAAMVGDKAAQRSVPRHGTDARQDTRARMYATVSRGDCTRARTRARAHARSRTFARTPHTHSRARTRAHTRTTHAHARTKRCMRARAHGRCRCRCSTTFTS